MITEPVKTFSRKFMGYDTTAVDAHIEMLTAKQQLLIDDVESLRARLQESNEQTAALRKEVAALTDTSPAPHAVQQRMAKMLARAVDEVAEMQAEARAEADALIAAAEAEAQAAERRRDEVLADMAAQQEALEAEYRETKEKLDAELADMRAEAQAAIDEARRTAERECEQLLGDAKQGADHYRDTARRAVEEASAQRIKILEQLMSVLPRARGRPGRAAGRLRRAAGLGRRRRAGGGGRQGPRGLSVAGRRYRRRRVDPQAVRRPGPPDCRCGARLYRAPARGCRHPRAPEPADIQNPSAAIGFGVGDGACPLRSGVQPARPV